MPRALAPEDRAILALESDVVVGHTCKVIRIGDAALALGDLRRSIAARLDRAPELTWRLSPDGQRWEEDEGFDLAAHVVDAPVDGPVDASGLPAVVAGLFAERLDRARPLWRLDAVAIAGEGQALVWRLHHALADGTTALRYAREVLWDVPPAPPASPAQRAEEERRRVHGLAFLHRELVPVASASPFDGAIGRRRAVAFASCSLSALHHAAKRTAGATLNDAVVTVVAGGVRRWLVRRGWPVRRMRVRVPVSLHAPGDAAANRDSFFSLRSYVTEEDPAVRLAEVHAATRVRKAEEDARRREALHETLEHVSPRVEHACLHLEDLAREYALAVSNVPGPRAVPTVLDRPVAALHTLAEIGRHHALRVAAISLADELGFGLCADPAIVPGLDELARDVETEAEALIGGAG